MCQFEARNIIQVIGCGYKWKNMMFPRFNLLLVIMYWKLPTFVAYNYWTRLVDRTKITFKHSDESSPVRLHSETTTFLHRQYLLTR